MEEAERAHLVVPEHIGRETRYRFVHELVRHTLAETLSMPRRQRLHARVADAVERLYASNLESQVPVLAHHLYQAGAAANPDKTLKYLMATAQRASAAVAHEEALAHFDNALSLIEDDRDARAAELHAGRAVALRSLGRLAEAVDSYERAIALFTEAGDFDAAAEASFHLTYVHIWKFDGQRALTVLDRALRLLNPESSPLRHRLLVFRAMCLGLFVEIEAGFNALAEAKLMEASLPERSTHGFASVHEAILHYSAAQFDRAGECAREAIARFRAAGDLWGESEVWQPVGVALWTGRPREAEALIRDLVARAERVGNQLTIANCKRLSAQIHLAMGELEQAERAACEVFDFDQAMLAGLSLDTVILGIVLHYRGRLEEAARWFRRGMEFVPLTPMKGLLEGGLFCTLAAEGNPAATEALARAYPLLPVPGRLLSIGACGCLEYVVEGLAWLGRREEAAALQPHAEHVVANGPLCQQSQRLFRTSAGIAAACAHNWSRAEEHHQAAIGQADTAPYRVAQPIARYWYAEMLLERDAPGDRARAHNLLSEALAMSESLGMPAYARRASERLASLSL